MSWQCRLIEYHRGLNGQSLKIGDMFYFNPPGDWRENDDAGWYWPAHFARDKVLSEFYKQNNTHRQPLLVFLPGRHLFCIDGACWRSGPDNKVEYYGGWQVSGEAPSITMSPSINLVGSYHGFLQNGVISDDCEGRRFDGDGRRINT